MKGIILVMSCCGLAMLVSQNPYVVISLFLADGLGLLLFSLIGIWNIIFNEAKFFKLVLPSLVVSLFAIFIPLIYAGIIR